MNDFILLVPAKEHEKQVKCGGVLENEVIHEYSPADRPDIIQRYWIKTDNNM